MLISLCFNVRKSFFYTKEFGVNSKDLAEPLLEGNDNSDRYGSNGLLPVSAAESIKNQIAGWEKLQFVDEKKQEIKEAKTKEHAEEDKGENKQVLVEIKRLQEEQQTSHLDLQSKADFARAFIEQGVWRLESLKFLYYMMPVEVVNTIIAAVIEKFNSHFTVNLDSGGQLNLTSELFKHLSAFPIYIEAIITKSINDNEYVKRNRLKEKIKPSRLAAWWAQEKRYATRSSEIKVNESEEKKKEESEQKEEPQQTDQLNALIKKLNQLQNATIADNTNNAENEEVKVSHKPNFYREENEFKQYVASVTEHEDHYLVQVNCMFAGVGTASEPQIEAFMQVFDYYNSHYGEFDSSEDLWRAADKNDQNKKLPEFFKRLKTPEKRALLAKLNQMYPWHLSNNQDKANSLFKQRIEAFIKSPSASFRSLWVRSQQTVTKFYIIDNKGNVVLQETSLRGGSLPAEKLEVYNDDRYYWQQMLVNLLQGMDMYLQLYVNKLADMMDEDKRALQSLSSVDLHPHYGYTSLLSPLRQDNYLRFIAHCICLKFPDNNSDMVEHLEMVLVGVIQGVLSGDLTLEEKWQEDMALRVRGENIPLTEALFNQLKRYQNASNEGIAIQGISVFPTAGFNNVSINEFRPKHRSCWSSLTGLVTHTTRKENYVSVDESLAVQRLGEREVVLAFASAMMDYLALVHRITQHQLNIVYGNLNSAIVAVCKLLREFSQSGDMRHIPIAELIKLNKRIKNLLNDIDTLLEKYSSEQKLNYGRVIVPISAAEINILKNMRLRLSALIPYLSSINNAIVPNYDQNNGLFQSSLAQILMDGADGSCKSSSDRYGFNEAMRHAMLACYHKNKCFPLYSNHYRGWFMRYQFLDLDNDSDYLDWLNDLNIAFIELIAHQGEVRNQLGGHAGHSLKSLLHILPPVAILKMSDKFGLDHAGFKKWVKECYQRLAKGNKIKKPKAPKNGFEIKIELIESDAITETKEKQHAEYSEEKGLVLTGSAESVLQNNPELEVALEEFYDEYESYKEKLIQFFKINTVEMSNLVGRLPVNASSEEKINPEEQANKLVKLLFPHPDPNHNDSVIKHVREMLKLDITIHAFSGIYQKLPTEFREIYLQRLMLSSHGVREFFCDQSQRIFFRHLDQMPKSLIDNLLRLNYLRVYEREHNFPAQLRQHRAGVTVWMLLAAGFTVLGRFITTEGDDDTFLRDMVGAVAASAGCAFAAVMTWYSEGAFNTRLAKSDQARMRAKVLSALTEYKNNYGNSFNQWQVQQVLSAIMSINTGGDRRAANLVISIFKEAFTTSNCCVVTRRCCQVSWQNVSTALYVLMSAFGLMMSPEVVGNAVGDSEQNNSEFMLWFFKISSFFLASGVLTWGYKTAKKTLMEFASSLGRLTHMTRVTMFSANDEVSLELPDNKAIEMERS